MLGGATWDELVEQVAAAARLQPAGTWILGRGWHQAKWLTAPEPAVAGTPTHAALSRVTPSHPVLLTHASGHMCVVNAQALRLAGIDAQTPSPDGGEVLHDAEGAPTGVLLENAMDLVSRVHDRELRQRSPEQTRADRLEAIRLAGDACLRHGVTSFCDAGEPFSVLDTFGELADAGQLPVRLWVMASDDNDSLAVNLARYRSVGRGNHYLTVRAIKRLVDGALGRARGVVAPAVRRSAHERRPEHAAPGRPAAHRRVGRYAQLPAVRARNRRPCQPRGTRPLRENVSLAGRSPRSALAHRTRAAPRSSGHAAICRMGRDRRHAGGACHLRRSLRRRAARAATSAVGAYAWQSLLDLGAVIANGTDVPVERIDPLPGFRAAVTREMQNGVAFYPEQCMTREEALRSYTLHAAYAAFEDDLKGSLTPGKLADIVVLSQDILQVPADQLPATHVVHTIVGGQIRYSRKPL